MTTEDLHFTGLAEFRIALRQFLSFSEKITREHGITAQQYQALLALKVLPQDARTVAHIAEQLLLKHHSAVELTKRMEKAGLISRLRDPADRRKARLELTELGLARLRLLAGLHREELLRHGGRIRTAIDHIEES
jgi:DNA-binding MarR family transcriptional regulator